ncbi:MAG: hypothetical protein JXR97_03725 [Planctomycetes bacterium]|nr:hypothetical protein [Planctomycetota bacterium]
MNRVMKWLLMTSGVAAILAGLFASCVYYSVKWEREEQYSRGFDAGQEEAEHDLNAANARIYAIGDRDSWKEYDPLSGLTVHAIAGCIVTNYDLGRSEGYNQAILKHIQRNGPPPNSRIRWSREILSPLEYMAGLGSAKLINLDETSGLVESPSGRFSIRLFIEHRTYPNGNKIMKFERLSLGRKDQNDQTIYFPGGDLQNVQPVRVAWGPEESDILFVRYRWENMTDVREGIAVMDLRTGLWLNYELIEK